MVSQLNLLTLRGLCPFWLGQQKTIEKPFHKTTQWADSSTRYPIRNHSKSRFPAFNIPKHSEEVATDTILSDTPAIDSGVTMAQMLLEKELYSLMSTSSNPKNNLSTH